MTGRARPRNSGAGTDSQINGLDMAEAPAVIGYLRQWRKRSRALAAFVAKVAATGRAATDVIIFLGAGVAASTIAAVEADAVTDRTGNSEMAPVAEVAIHDLYVPMQWFRVSQHVQE